MTPPSLPELACAQEQGCFAASRQASISVSSQRSVSMWAWFDNLSTSFSSN